jgi:hypothetical protein
MLIATDSPTHGSRYDDMTWQDVVAPLLVIGLMGEIIFFIVTSEAVRGNRPSRFLPTKRDIAAMGRLWRRRWRRARSA